MEFNIVSPGTTEDLLKFISENRDKNFRIGAGYTDLLPEIKKNREEGLIVVNLADLKDDMFTSVKECNEGLRIGALVTIAEITSGRDLQKRFPVLYKAAVSLASVQIRRSATVGGNLCTASPAGDIGCALVALEAECEILSGNGTMRVVPIEKFFIDVKKTDLKKDEILRSVLVPFNINGKKLHSDFIKVGTRRSMEIAVISLAYHIQADKDDTVAHAGIAIGSVAPTIRFVHSACDFLKGKKFLSLKPPEAEEFAIKIVGYSSPISDIRASAWYRKEVLYNISKNIVADNN